MGLVGSVLGSALAMDKIRCKWLFQAQQLPTAPFAVVHSNDTDFAGLLAVLGGKVMVKPANEGSSIGMSAAASAEELLWRQTPGGELVDLGRPHRVPLGQLRLQRAPKGILSRREILLLGVLALVVHGAVIYWISQKPTPCQNAIGSVARK